MTAKPFICEWGAFCKSGRRSPCGSGHRHLGQGFRQWAKVSLLIIDDFGLKPLRPPHDEDFHDLIAGCYEQATTMVTSNLDFSEWGEVFPANRMLGVATLDRLRHGAYRLILEGESYRTPRPLPESPKKTVAKHPKIAQP